MTNRSASIALHISLTRQEQYDEFCYQYVRTLHQNCLQGSNSKMKCIEDFYQNFNRCQSNNPRKSKLK